MVLTWKGGVVTYRGGSRLNSWGGGGGHCCVREAHDCTGKILGCGFVTRRPVYVRI